MRVRSAFWIGFLLLAAGAPGARAESDDALTVKSGAEARDADLKPTVSLKALRIPPPDSGVWKGAVLTAARREGLPPEFLDRVIRRESGYFPLAQSRAGAAGIAQFMPATAKDRGLDDPYDPNSAIPAAAAYLGGLKRQFGELSLAAAAYNAGPGAVAKWLAGQGALPAETLAYVRAVSGVSLDGGSETRPKTGAKTLRDLKTPLSEASLCATMSTQTHPCIVQKQY